ncbi:lipocalin family protein [Aquimarina brevivitae]|uniref:Lipocalin-like protein n=1 Tax=Aquimarina brevivitae TaxID=323412 RepID=A0A4Q7P128_9FLAO|nr:lipocalin family protein [Aquimarina brevivitae]RZS93523.1 lipocalin-like protein [Aquimarina brevivitae]
MKKLTFTLLLAITATLFSCQTDDDATPQDPIMGNWQLKSESANGIIIGDDDCRMQSTITFSADKYNYEDFDENENGNCIKASGAGVWKYFGDGVYGIADSEEEGFDSDEFFTPIFDGDEMTIRLEFNTGEDFQFIYEVVYVRS